VARLVQISQEELAAVRRLYESVMSYACHGLFFREGMALADELLKNLPTGVDPLLAGRALVLERGWADDVLFTDKGARVRGSIEVAPGSEMETCHRVRGVLSKVLEAKARRRVRLQEVECASTGARECVFEPEGSA
jgi:predicted hydrocarbon binding protein